MSLELVCVVGCDTSELGDLIPITEITSVLVIEEQEDPLTRLNDRRAALWIQQVHRTREDHRGTDPAHDWYSKRPDWFQHFHHVLHLQEGHL